jgi:Ice-binding-like
MITHSARLAVFASLVASTLVACGTSPAASGASSTRAAKLATAKSSTPAFGTAGNFAILASTAVTCSNATITGNVGVAPGTSITQTNCPVTGTINPGDATATQAQLDFLVAYDSFKALPCTQTLTTLDGLTLTPGVYCFDAAATSTGGVLTLNGPATGTWIFKIGTLGTGALTGTNFSVVTPAGTPPPCNSVYWWTAEAATLTDSTFVGTILAGAAVTLTRGTFNGDAYSKAAVTITGDAVTGCALGGGTSTCTGKDDEEGDCQCKGGDDDEDRMSRSAKSHSREGKCGGHGHHRGDGKDDDDRDGDDD